jgi:hypothetical protein
MRRIVVKMGIVEQCVVDIGQSEILGVIDESRGIEQSVGGCGQIIVAVVRIAGAVLTGIGDKDGMILAVELFRALLPQGHFPGHIPGPPCLPRFQSFYCKMMLLMETVPLVMVIVPLIVV